MRSFTVLLLTLLFPVTATAAPKTEWQTQTYDFGTVYADTFITTKIHVKNVGDTVLKFLSIRPSCGCTAAFLKDTEALLPGQESDLVVRINTAFKRGHILKTVRVTTNEPGNPVYRLRFEANVIPQTTSSNFHQNKRAMQRFLQVGNTYLVRSCARCHRDPGLGKTGKALYDAVCAMCHGNKTYKRIYEAPRITQRYRNSFYIKHYLRRVISRGTKNPMMPAFGRGHGDGFLTKQQVDSLITYLTHRSKH